MCLVPKLEQHWICACLQKSNNVVHHLQRDFPTHKCPTAREQRIVNVLWRDLPLNNTGQDVHTVHPETSV